MRGAAGFTLIEVLVVLVILGLVAGIVIEHGPSHSASLDVRAGASEIAQALRLARTQAIATDRTQRFQLDAAAGFYRLGAAAPHRLPPRLAFAMTAAGDGRGRPIAAISFMPDGTSSGGRVVVAEGTRRILIGVDWLTGRVDMVDASPR